MEKTSSNNKQRVYRLKITLIMALTFFVLVSIAGATPYAYITNEGSNTVSVIDTATNSVAATVNVGNYPYGVAISPDGNMVYVTDYATANGVYGLSVSVIDTSRNSVIATWPTFDTMASPRGVAVSPDEAKLYVTNAYNRIYAFDTTTNKVIANSSGGSCPVGVAITPDRTKAYVTYSDEDYVGIFDTVSDKIKGVVHTNIQRYGQWGVAINRAGTKVFVANRNNNTVSVIDTTTDMVTSKVNVGNSPEGVLVNPAGTMVYVANYGSNTVSVINTKSNKVTATVPVGINPIGVSVTPDGTKVFVANYGSNTVSVINTKSNTISNTVNVGSRPVAFGQFIIPAPNLFSYNKVIGTRYPYQAWGKYPLINLFGQIVVPLFSNGDPIWKNHVNLVAPLVRNSNNMIYLSNSQTIGLGNGYNLTVKQVDVDGRKVWLELDHNGQYVDDAIVSTDSGDYTWTYIQSIQGIPNVPVLKIHVNKIYQGAISSIVQIDGIWLIDSTKASTLYVGQKFGNIRRCEIITNLINGTSDSFLGEIVYKIL